MLIGIINDKIEELIYKDIQHIISVELRKVFAKCDEDEDALTVENQEDVLNQVMTRSQAIVRKDYSEPVNARLQHLLDSYTCCLCHTMLDNIVDVADRLKVRYSWNGLADYYLLTMYGQADRIADTLARRKAEREREGSDDVE